MEILYVLAAAIFLLRPEVTSEYAAIACRAIENIVIRSLFPMSVFTKLISSSKIMAFASRKIAKSALWRRLNISDTLLPLVLGGLVSGFPSSAQGIQEVFESGRITKSECAKALSLSSLPSPAFIILVASESLKIGLLRYVVLVVVSYITALFFKSSKSLGESEALKISVSRAIMVSAQSMLIVAGNIAFFSAMTCVCASVLPSFKTEIAVFFEMGSGVLLSRGSALVPIALGWCGVSAMMQIRSLAPDIPIKAYLVTRLMSVLGLLMIEFLKNL